MRKADATDKVPEGRREIGLEFQMLLGWHGDSCFLATRHPAHADTLEVNELL